MENMITIRECEKSEERIFITLLHEYFERDIAPHMNEEDRDYFLSVSYLHDVKLLHDDTDEDGHIRYIFIKNDGELIGFLMLRIWKHNDGRCLLMEFCILPKYRNKGFGIAAAKKCIDFAAQNGAAYIDANYISKRAKAFWEKIGFEPNGADEDGSPLMTYMINSSSPISVKQVTHLPVYPAWHMLNSANLERGDNAYADIEPVLQFRDALTLGHTAVFTAVKDKKYIGILVLSRFFSTKRGYFSAVIDRLYVEPLFSKTNAKELLIKEAIRYCADKCYEDMYVSDASDNDLYERLGFACKQGAMHLNIAPTGDSYELIIE